MNEHHTFLKMKIEKKIIFFHFLLKEKSFKNKKNIFLKIFKC